MNRQFKCRNKCFCGEGDGTRVEKRGIDFATGTATESPTAPEDSGNPTIHKESEWMGDRFISFNPRLRGSCPGHPPTLIEIWLPAQRHARFNHIRDREIAGQGCLPVLAKWKQNG